MKNRMKNMTASANALTRRGFAAVLVRGSIGLVVMVTAGCGGGGDSKASQSSPTDATRSRVFSLHDVAVRGITQSGFQTLDVAFSRNSFHGGGAEGGFGDAATAADRTGAPMPLLGAFLRNIAATAPLSRAARLRGQSRQEGKPDGSPPDGGEIPPPDGDFDPPPTFYFDYYLGLWVQIEETAGTSKYLLFEDEEKTRPAGHITTVNPTDWETFPQVYASSYEFTSGYLAGSHGSSDNTTNADYSGSSRYENVYADGWKDKGTSNWSAQGDFSWSSRTDGAGGEWSEGAGTFRTDGSGGMRLSSSDGYKSDYRYNADGSGHGRITGPDPGLPVTLNWDAYGNTTITYADGTTEHISGWGSDTGGGDDPILIDSETPITTSP